MTVEPRQSKTTDRQHQTCPLEVLSKDAADNRFMWVQGGTD